MSRSSYFKHYAPMGTEKQDLGRMVPEEMEIELYYSLGGPNYFSGGQDPRGLWLSFWPVMRTEGSCQRSIPDPRGRRIFVEQLARNSAKRGEAWATIVGANIEDIATASIQQDWAGVKAILEDRREKEVA